MIVGRRRKLCNTAICCTLVLLAAVINAQEASVDATEVPKLDAEILTGHITGTDPASAEKERESMNSPTYQRKLRSGAEEFTFQTEVNRMMDILIHSLYSNKDIFLRELISNASDALDKIRFLSLTDKNVLGEGECSNLEIRIKADKTKKILEIRDKGIGMTKEELIKNLGTIAKSGTSGFLEQMQKGGDINLIGQFGVGFYSAYLAADYVEVVSKHNDDKQYIWSSSADGSFNVIEDTENEPLGRGTLIRLHMKDDADEYLEEPLLQQIVTKYSQFINFPIYLLMEKEIDVPVEDVDASDDETKPEETSKDDEEVEDEDEPESAEKEEKPKTRKEKRSEWEVLNDSKAIWLRSPNEVEDEEYKKFYKALAKDQGEALRWAHFKAEGDVEFRSIIFIPTEAPFDYYDRYYDRRNTGIKLYVRRVFISDELEELIPRYLGFLKGVVDSDTLPINISREMLQTHSSLRTIRKKLVRKALDLIKRLADDEEKCKEGDKKEDNKDSEDGDDKCDKYTKFWEQFGRSMKLGIIEDGANRNRLSKLLRFHTTKSLEAVTHLDGYVSRMKEGQKQLYFLAGANTAELKDSPFVERLVKKGYEVILFTDVLDEYLMTHLQEYDDFKFADATKEDLQLSGVDDGKDKARDKAMKEEFKELTEWWKRQLGSDVTAVKVSNRLSTSPCVVVTGKYGQSANMQRIMKAQAFGDPSRMAMMQTMKSLEINPRHPLIRALRDRVKADDSDATVVNSAKVLYEAALLESGFTPDDAKALNSRLQQLIKDSLGLGAALDDVEAEEEEDSDGATTSDEKATPATDASSKATSETAEKEEL